MRRRVSLIVVLLTLCAPVIGCAGGEGPLPHQAVTTVTELLELRRDDIRDADAYASYFEDAAMADALAGASDVPTGTPRVPPYRAPYLSAESTSTAEVAVVWEEDAEFPDWAPVTVFRTRLTDGVWRVIDAVETTAAPEPLLPEAD